MRASLVVGTAALVIGLAGSVAASAVSIFAGPGGESPRDVMCPRLEAALKRSGFTADCQASRGAGEHLKLIGADPKRIAIGPLDALAEALGDTRAQDAVSIVRTERAQACLMVVTRAPGVTGSGEIGAWAGKLKLYVAEAPGGAAATLSFLRRNDPDGFGKAPAAVVARSSEDAVRQALASDDGAALLVEVPDGSSPRLTLARELGGRIVPVLERGLLAREIAGERIYVTREVEIAAGSWSTAPTRIATMCSPIAVYTGAFDRVPAGSERQEHTDTVAAIATLDAGALVAGDDRLERLLKRARELSGASVEEALRLSEEARVKAKPYVDKARPYVDKAIVAGKEALAAGKEAAKEAAEAARPIIAKAKALSERALERAREELKEFLDDVMPPAPKK